MRFKDIPAYLRGLQVGQRVVETAPTCMKGRKGTVYHRTVECRKTPMVCVKWDAAPNETGQMSTDATYGTRRIVHLGQLTMIETAPGVLEGIGE